MTKVSINAPRTPVTEGSSGIAAATLPNICKMPGPPAPFVPTPLPNIGKSGTSPKGYSKTVTIEGQKVAIRGATFGSMGDVASKGTGGGLISSNVEGPTRFVGPGSMSVKMEGKNVQLLGDPMLNNCGPSGNPANAATMTGVLQPSGMFTYVTGEDACPLCDQVHGQEIKLDETKATKVSAQALADKLTAQSYANTTMLGVVQCKCDKHYADRSGLTDAIFCKTVEDLKWHGPKIDDAVPPSKPDDTKEPKMLVFLKGHFKKHQDKVAETWARAYQRHNDFEDSKRKTAPKKLPAAYPPGSCAAPKILVLVMMDNGEPAGITEQWFHKKGKGNPTGANMKYFDNRDGSNPKTPTEGPFDHGQTVPPCDTCDLLLAMMLCPDGHKMECQHLSKATP